MEIQKNKFIFGILFLMIILSLSFVVAQPPVQQTQILTKGIQIQVPIFETIKNSQDFNFDIHTYNLSNGILLTNDTIDFCSIHIYNQTNGRHIIQENMSFDPNGFDWEFNVGGENFTKNGMYAILIYCEVTGVTGGFFEYGFEVTQTGEALDQPQSYIILGLILLLIFLSGIFLYIGKDMEYLPAKIFLMSLGLLFLMFVVGVSLNIINQLLIVGAVVAGTFGSLYTLMTILISAWGIGLIVFLIYMAVKQFYSNRGIIDEFDDD